MSINRTLAPALATALFGASLALSAPVFAQAAQGGSGQGAQSGGMTQQGAPSSADITDEQLAKFSEAQQDVHQVREEWQDQMHDADDKKAAMKNRQKANQAMVEAIQQHGLSVEKYNNIIRAAQSDPKMAQRIQQDG